MASYMIFEPFRGELAGRDGNREPVLYKNRFPVVKFFGIVSLFAYQYHLPVSAAVQSANFSLCAGDGR